MELNLPPELQSFVDMHVTTGQYENGEAYVEALVRNAKNNLETLLQEGFDSGDPIPITSDDFRKLKEQISEKSLNAVQE